MVTKFHSETSNLQKHFKKRKSKHFEHASKPSLSQLTPPQHSYVAIISRPVKPFIVFGKHAECTRLSTELRTAIGRAAAAH